MPNLRPDDLEARVVENLRLLPALSRYLGEAITEFVRQPGANLEHRLVRHLYIHERRYIEPERLVADRLDSFLRNGELQGIDFSIPLGALRTNLAWGLKAVIAELRAGLQARQDYPTATIQYLRPGDEPTPDFQINQGQSSEYAEVKSVEGADLFDLITDKAEARLAFDSRFAACFVLKERLYFTRPWENPRDLAGRMAQEVDRVLEHVQERLPNLPLRIGHRDLGLEFIAELEVRPGADFSLMAFHEYDFELMEINARCCDTLSRGILSRVINQVTQGYWKLREFRGARPAADHIYIEVDFRMGPFEDARAKVLAILDIWGISNWVNIHFI